MTAHWNTEAERRDFVKVQGRFAVYKCSFPGTFLKTHRSVAFGDANYPQAQTVHLIVLDIAKIDSGTHSVFYI